VYEPVRSPFFVDYDRDNSMSPVPAGVIERMLPRSLRRNRAGNRLEKQIGTLVMRNLENLRWETMQNVDAAFRKFSSDLDADLHLSIEATHGAIRSALARRKRCEVESSDRLIQLKKAAAEIQEAIRQSEAAQNMGLSEGW